MTSLLYVWVSFNLNISLISSSKNFPVISYYIDRQYLMEHFLIISSDNGIVHGNSSYFNTLSSLGSCWTFQQWKWSKRGCGMILTGEKRIIERESSHSASLSTTHPTWTDMGSKMGLCDEKLVTNIIRLNLIHITYTRRHSISTSQRTKCASIEKTRPLMLYREVIAVYRKRHKDHRYGLHCVCRMQSF